MNLLCALAWKRRVYSEKLGMKLFSKSVDNYFCKKTDTSCVLGFADYMLSCESSQRPYANGGGLFYKILPTKTDRSLPALALNHDLPVF